MYWEMLIKYTSRDAELVVGYISFGERYGLDVKNMSVTGLYKLWVYIEKNWEQILSLRAVCVVLKWLQDNTDICLIPPTHPDYESLLSVIYILLFYQIRSSERNMTELYYLSPCRSVFTTMISFYISVCSNKEPYRDSSATAIKLLNILPWLY